MDKPKIAIVIPTIRPEQFKNFLNTWENLFKKHFVTLVVVHDGENPYIETKRWIEETETYTGLQVRADETLEEVMGENSDLISNKCAASRNLGFAFISKFLPEIEYIITLDDDEEPVGDPIQDHINALNQRVPISWFPTTIINKSTDYMRGFPYGVREEAEVIISHGVWSNNPDYDAPSQLHSGNKEVPFYKGVIPKGVFFPFCGMNVAFKRKALPLIYYAPVGQYKGAERFDDIWAGLEIKKEVDSLGYAIVTGYATCNHTRASNVFNNLEHEAVGIRKNEEYWKGETDEWYEDFINKRKRWNDYNSKI